VGRSLHLWILIAVSSEALAESPPGEIRGQVKTVRPSVGAQSNGPDDAVVFLEDAALSGEMPKGPFEMKQASKSFRPSVLIVPRGEKVSFPNRDVLQHNVFSLSPANTFDLGLYGPGEARSQLMDKPGIVALYCNIHPQMLGYLVVVTNPFFTRPGADGKFVLRNVPPGIWHLVAWFPYGEAERHEVTVGSGQVSEVDPILRERGAATRHNRKDGSAYTSY
jgi:plastocyanin